MDWSQFTPTDPTAPDRKLNIPKDDEKKTYQAIDLLERSSLDTKQLFDVLKTGRQSGP